MSEESVWPIYKGTGTTPHNDIERLPAPPGWRAFERTGDNTSERATPPDIEADLERGRKFQTLADQVQLINAAIFLRRPLLITGKPGTGKSTLAYAVAQELKLGPVLVWPITTRTTLQEGLYSYDAIGRLQDGGLLGEGDEAAKTRKAPPIEDYLRLGPLGTALLPSKRPRLLLIDEIDKSDLDLPNNLLNVLEEGQFKIAELVRQSRRKVAISPSDASDKGDRVAISDGLVQCTKFPVVVMTSNGEREFPPAFLRRCLRLEMPIPSVSQLSEIVKAHFSGRELQGVETLIQDFAAKSQSVNLATDQLLNSVYLVLNGVNPKLNIGDKLLLDDFIQRDLNSD